MMRAVLVVPCVTVARDPELLTEIDVTVKGIAAETVADTTL